MGAYEKLFNEKPRTTSPPWKREITQNLMTLRRAGEEDTTKYQSMIGALQWLISLGRFDISCAVMTMSKVPCCSQGLDTSNASSASTGMSTTYPHGRIRIRTEAYDYSEVPSHQHDWMYTVYGGAKEIVPEDIPEPLGNEVVTTTYVDANLYHDMLSGRAVTGILHLLNGTPIDWYSKRQGTVETATYGSEFVAARIATDQIVDLRYTLRYLGVPIRTVSYMFGDNQSVVTSSTLPQSALSKRPQCLVLPPCP